MKHLFNCRENEMTGEYGWVMRGKPWMEPFELAVAHDCLEHFSDDTGRIEDELQALGAMRWVRSMSRVFNNSRFSWAENVWLDITRQYHEYNPTSAPLRPLRMRYGIIDDDLNELNAQLYIPHRDDFETLCRTNWNTPEQRRYLKAWIVRGYCRARRRYPDQYAVGSLYDSIYEQMQKIVVTEENQNDTLVVRYTNNSNHASVRIAYGGDDESIE